MMRTALFPLKLIALGLTLGITVPALAAPYVPPSGIGAPGRRESAGTRGCVYGTPGNLIAIAPQENIGWTTKAYPQFYWYLPVNDASFVEFTLEKTTSDANSVETIYSSRFEVTGESGIMSLQLPETAGLPPLEEGDRYRWQISIFCNPNAEEGELQVDGWIERRSPDEPLATQLESASGAEQAGLYATNGYWFDAVEQFAALHRAEPENEALQASWAELLESVKLEPLADQPFTQQQ